MLDKKQVIRNILNSDENRLAYRKRSSFPFFLAILIGFISIVFIMNKTDAPDRGAGQPEISLQNQMNSQIEDVKFVTGEQEPETTTSVPHNASTNQKKKTQTGDYLKAAAIPKDQNPPTDAIASQGRVTPDAIASQGSVTPDAIASQGSVTPDAIASQSSVTPDSIASKSNVTPPIAKAVSPANDHDEAIAIPMDEIVGPEPPKQGDEPPRSTSLMNDDNYFRDGLILAQAKDFLAGTNGKNKDYNKALPLLLDLAGRGSTSAQFELAKLYRFGYGVEQNIDTAVSYYRKAANGGFGDAQCSLGALYYKGTGVTKSFTMAVLYFKKAADHGDRTGQFNLGCSYLDGTGVNKDRAEALKWFKLSAEQDYEPAIALLKKIDN